MTIARQLAVFVSSANLSDVDQGTIERSKLHILDILGCIAFSTELDYAQSIAMGIATDPGPYSLPGISQRLTLADAALLSGTLAAGFELDDVGVFVHPGACVVPAAFLAADRLKRETGRVTTGAELLMAVIIGYEVTVRISDWIGFGPEDQIGWHTPAFHGAIGAAAAAARIWNLDETQTTHAIASATDLAGGGLMQARFGSDIKRLHTGRATQTGIVSALLAERGIRGREDVFEDPRWGYFRTIRYRGVPETESDLSGGKVLDGLGREFGALPKIALKYFPCTAGAQSILDNVVAACTELGSSSEDIERIDVDVSSWFYEQPETLRPATGIEAVNFSYAYAAAIAAVELPSRLVDEGANVRIFVNGIDDSRVMALQEKVRFAPSTEIDSENRYSMDTAAEVHLRDGRSARRRTSYGVKSRDDSDGAIAFDVVSPEGIRRKFDNLVEVALAPATAKIVGDGIEALEEQKDVASLWRSYCDPTKGD